MSEERLTPIPSDELTLADAVNRVLDRGVVATGDVVIGVAGVDLVYLGLHLALSSVETLRRREAAAAPEEPRLAASFEQGGIGPTAGVGEPAAADEPLFRVTGGAEASAVVPDSLEPPSIDRLLASSPEPAELSPAPLDPAARDVDTALAQLVLTVVELLRRVLEHQAVRRMEGGALRDEEIERLGLALMRLQERLGEIKRVFGLADEDLNIDLGPLGKLL